MDVPQQMFPGYMTATNANGTTAVSGTANASATVAANAAGAPLAPVNGAPPAATSADKPAQAPAPAQPAGQVQLTGTTEKPPYPPPAPMPTHEGPLGIKFDFNNGARVVLPDNKSPWRIRLSDIDTGNILFETTFQSGAINSTKRYYVRFKIEAWQQDKPVFTHEYSAKDRNILIQFPVGTLGDTMGWFPYAVKFKEKHGCKLTCSMGEKLIPLFRDAYPDITFVSHEEVKAEQFYATYCIGLFFDDKDLTFQPCDFRYVGLHRTAGYILGVDPTEVPPKLSLENDTRPIPEPYVCIAAQSTTQSKYWNNPDGWRAVVKMLKDAGYRVICIDQKPAHGHGLIWNQIPFGCEDETGERSLQERARWLKHCDFFIGLSSGLSWLAWAAGCPVVMISGFTHPLNEFETPYRVINYHTCNSCWNDPHLRFDHKDFLWCPRHKDTPRQFECTRLITVDQVKATIRTVPQFARMEAKAAAAAAGKTATKKA